MAVGQLTQSPARRSSSGLVRTRPKTTAWPPAGVVAVRIASDGNGAGVTTRGTITAKIAAIAATSSRARWHHVRNTGIRGPGGQGPTVA
jgi:hypothetical protein